MCDLKVILEGKTVFEDAIFAKSEGSNVLVRDVLGNSTAFDNCTISEVDINSERLVLSSTQTQ